MKSRTYLYHFLFWISLYLLWVAIFRSYSVAITQTMTIEFCYLIFITADYYAINNFTIPKLLVKSRYLTFGLVTFLIIVLSAVLRSIIAWHITREVFEMSGATISTLFVNSLLNISLWVLLVTLIKMLIDRMQTQQLVVLLEQERVKSELNYLKAQINPHALFNSLNTIYGHIDKGNQTARNTLLQFSELLRYQLYDCSIDKVSLEKEITYIRNYVDFHRLRKDEKLKVSLTIEVEQKNLQIAPLLLIVLIENAFKFVSDFQHRENQIDIHLRTNGSVLQGFFSNSKENTLSTHNKSSVGIGLANLNRRLELLYPGKFTMNTLNDPERYETHLTIDLR